VGRILEALERNSLTENTLVIITSDNGAHCGSSETGEASFHYFKQYGHRSNHIYRGQKSDAWDGGHRIPFLARWPGVITPGSRCEETICLTDLLATTAAMLGTRLPADAGEDSYSILPLFTEETHTAIREATVHHSITGQFAIRQGPWKLLVCPGSGGWSLPDESVPASAPRMQLYNMQANPEETENLVNDEPAVVERLLGILNRYREDARSAPAMS